MINVFPYFISNYFIGSRYGFIGFIVEIINEIYVRSRIYYRI